MAIPLECVALTAVRRASGLSAAELARKTGINRPQLSRYETRTAPPEDRLVLLLATMKCPRYRYEAVLSCLRVSVASFSATPVDPAPAERHEIEAVSTEVGRAAGKLVEECLVELVRGRKTREARAEAEALAAWLERQEKPWLIVEKAREVQTWAVAEALAQRSAEAALEQAGCALELAGLAWRVAEIAPCSGLFQNRLLGHILAFQENAVRVAGDLSAADALWRKAEGLWRLGGAGEPGPFAAWQRLDFAGSLRRDQRRLDEAVAQLDMALSLAPAEAKGRILVNKATVLEQMGDFEQALALLAEAERIVDRERDARLFLIVRFNRATVLTLSGRCGEAHLLLPELGRMAKKLGLERLQIRVLWLAGSIAAGLGSWSEAESLLARVLRDFTRRGEAWECALATLQLGVLLCRRKKTREAGRLATDLRWIFEEEKLGHEARAALRRFCDTDEASSLTLEIAEEALQSFQRAPKADLEDPEDSGGPYDLGTASDYASKHGFCSFRQQMGEGTSFLPSIMVRRTDPDDLQVLVRVLMAWRNWNQRQFAAAAGVSKDTISHYQSGKTKPDRAMVEKLAASAGMPLLLVDFFLLPAIAAEREGAGRTGGDVEAAVLERLAAQLQGITRRLGRTALAIGGAVGSRPEEESGWPTAAEREEAIDLWSRLEDCADPDRWYLVETCREFQHRGLVERLCHESAEAASDQAGRACEFARLEGNPQDRAGTFGASPPE